MPTLAPFEVHRATSVTEASELLAELGPGAVIYSGGTELLLLMKLGFASFEHLVDIKPIETLGRLDADGDVLRIGGTVTHRRVERSPAVAERWPDLVEMERVVANVRVRNVGSLGGNLAFADPHSDPATFLLAAGASVTLQGAGEARTVPLEAFVLGPYETTLEPGELLCSIDVPAPAPGSAMAHLRFAFHERPAATVSAMVEVAGGTIRSARVAVGSVGAVPVLVPGVEDALVGQPAAGVDEAVLLALAEAGATAAEPVTDANGSDDYKHALVRTMIGRALDEAARRASERGTR
jgi:carbon-monoxide dehydrogenase medium subunit